jgi:hypothetical protein
MEIFKTREFARLARKGRVSDLVLVEAVSRANRGLVDARIGRFLVKQRVAREGQGRSGGFRAILFYRESDRAVFLHLFAKSERDNLTRAEEDAYRDFAREMAELTDEAVATLVEAKKWIRIDNDAG